MRCASVGACRGRACVRGWLRHAALLLPPLALPSYPPAPPLAHTPPSALRPRPHSPHADLEDVLDHVKFSGITWTHDNKVWPRARRRRRRRGRANHHRCTAPPLTPPRCLPAPQPSRASSMPSMRSQRRLTRAPRPPSTSGSRWVAGWAAGGPGGGLPAAVDCFRHGSSPLDPRPSPPPPPLPSPAHPPRS